MHIAGQSNDNSFKCYSNGVAMVTHLGGFSTVRYVLKSAISFCMPAKELENSRSLRATTVLSIQSSRFEQSLSYSFFMFSMSTIIPTICRPDIHNRANNEVSMHICVLCTLLGNVCHVLY